MERYDYSKRRSGICFTFTQIEEPYGLTVLSVACAMEPVEQSTESPCLAIVAGQNIMPQSAYQVMVLTPVAGTQLAATAAKIVPRTIVLYKLESPSLDPAMER
jgi:hypothetical protein